MSDPSDRRSRDLATAEVDGLLARSRRLLERDAPRREATWRRLASRLEGRHSSGPALAVRWWRLGLAASAVAAVLSFVGFGFITRLSGDPSRGLSPTPRAVQGAHPAPLMAQAGATHADAQPEWQEQALGLNGSLTVAPLARFRLPDDSAPAGAPYVITLDQGEVCAQVAHRDPVTQGPFVVQAPLLRAIAVGTRFCVFAGPDAASSWVMVEEGRVRVEGRSGESRLVEAGTLVHGVELQAPSVQAGLVAPPAPATAARLTHPVGSACGSSSPGKRDACLWRKASGEGLAAQNALYLLGSEAERDQESGRALAIWRSYLLRFPDGILAAEASFNAFGDLLRERHFEEALGTVDDLLLHHASFVRAGEARLRRADLLRNELDRPLAAREEYQRILAGEARDVLRDDALYGLGRCQEELHHEGAAQSAWNVYLREFPAGKHRAEVLTRRHAD